MKPGRIKLIVSLLIVCFARVSWAQFDDRGLYSSNRVIIKEESYFNKPVQIIDMPTASILRGGSFRAGVRIFEQGGVLAQLSAGISNKVMFGVSYGGLNIIGASQSIQWNSIPGVQFIYRITDESMRLPAIVAGFDSQGFGPLYSSDSTQVTYDADYGDSYHFKSRGFFIAISKGYASIVNAGLHAGISYSLENGFAENNAPTIYMAMDIHLARDLALLIEYDFATNDSELYPQGLLNWGVRWAFGSNMFFDFNMQNTLGKRDGVSDVRRIVKLTYYGSILR